MIKNKLQTKENFQSKRKKEEKNPTVFHRLKAVSGDFLKILYFCLFFE